MEPIKLPLLPTGEDNTYIVLLPGLDRAALKKWTHELDEEAGVLKITCYYGGFTEEGEIDALTYPVQLSEEDLQNLKNLETLHPMNPLEVDLEQYYEPDEARRMRRFFKQLENKYGRPLEGED